MQPIRNFAVRYSAIVWSRRGLTSKELAKQLWKRNADHKLADRAALLSLYFLIALFPLLIVLSSLIGFILSSQTGTYLNLVNYLEQIMPHSAFAILNGMLGQITSGASSGKLSFGVVVSLWTASSGVGALIEALNVAFEVPISRSWLHRRLVAIALTLGIGVLLMASLLFLFAGNTAAEVITAHLPVQGGLGRSRMLPAGWWRSLYCYFA